MKGKNRLVGIILSVSLMLALVVAACVPKAPAPAKGVLKHGDLADLTGPSAASGITMSEAMKAYVDYINKKGGIKGHPVELMVIDTAFDIPRNLAGFKRLKEWGVLTTSQISTKGALALKDMHTADKIPCVANSATLAAYWPPGYTYCHYTVRSSDAIFGLNWLWTKKWDYAKQGPLKIAMVGNDEPLGRFNIPVGVKYAEYLGKGKIQVVGIEYLPMPPIDVTVNMKRLVAANPDWVMNFSNNPALAPVTIGDAAKVGAKWQWLHQVGTLFHNQVSTIPALVQGHYIATVWGQPEDKGWGIDLAKEFMLARGHSEEKIVSVLWEDILMGMNQVLIAFKAIEMALDKVGYENLTPEAVKVYGLDKMSKFDTGGINAGISYTDYPDDREGPSKLRILQVKGTKFVPVTDWLPIPPEAKPSQVMEWSK